MKSIFDISKKHTLLEANSNFYPEKAMHPSRIMNMHDLVYMVQGEWTVGQDGTELHAKKDSVFILNAKCSHYGVNPCAPNTKTMYLHVEYFENERLAKENEQPKNGEIIVENIIDCSANPMVKRCFCEIIYALSSGNTALASSYFDVLLLELQKKSSLDGTGELAEKIKNTITLSDGLMLSNSEIAKLHNVSAKTAEQAFKKCYGLTIHTFMITHKLEKAKFYLSNFPEMTLRQIAESLGFFDEYHLSKRFKAHFGISPSKFKNK